MNSPPANTAIKYTIQPIIQQAPSNSHHQSQSQLQSHQQQTQVQSSSQQVQPSTSQQPPQQAPTDMSFYAQVQVDPKNPFNIFPANPIGFHHSPFSLVPNPTANPLLQSGSTEGVATNGIHPQQNCSASSNISQERAIAFIKDVFS